MPSERFSSSAGAILTMVGVAVGLGNVWRFPYMMGSYGGSAFLLIYLVFLVFLAMPAIMAEWGLGRGLRSGPVNAYQRTLGHRFGAVIGWVLVFAVFMADSYYVVVIGQILTTSVAVTFNWKAQSNWPTIAATGLIVACTYWVLSRGLKRGIEAVSRVIVPFFLLAMVALAVRAWTLDGATEAMAEFLKPDFSAIGATEIFAAMGQACFSLGLGGTLYVMYGSYLNKDQSLAKTAGWTAFGDVGAAIMASLFIVPAVLALGLNMAAGPGLLFNTLPQLFAEMASGPVLGLLFLLALGAVAFLSSLAAMEVVQHELKAHVPKLKNHAIGVSCGALAIAAIPPAVNPELIGTLDLIFGSGMLMFGCLMAVIAFGWGVPRLQAGEELGSRSSVLLPWLRFVVPVAIGAILIGYLVSV